MVQNEACLNVYTVYYKLDLTVVVLVAGESMAWPFAERGDDSQSSPSSSFAVDSISPEEVSDCLSQ